GIGRAVAERLASEGAAVGLVDLDGAALAATVENLAMTSKRIHGVKANVSQAQEVEAAVTGVESTLGPITMLVNNAGISVIKPYIDHTDDEFQRQLQVNLV